ncbi:MAG: hypothetical protein RL654_2227 [Pseudomonadota bacterium]
MAAALMALSVLPAVATPPQAVARTHGEALWRGERPLAGQIAGHAQAMPVAALRCINCHGGGLGAVPGSAPRLDAATLTRPLARRGGPPSVYDERAFCQLLRTGIDPAAVLLPREMPRYRIDDHDCAALWRHLVATR